MFKIFANYSDGTYDDMDTTDFALVKKDILKSFFVSKDEKPYFELFFEKGQRPIYRRRTIMNQGGGELKIIIIGWQKRIGNENIQSLNYIFPEVMITKGRFEEGVFAEPQWHKYEDKDSICDCGCSN